MRPRPYLPESPDPQAPPQCCPPQHRVCSRDAIAKVLYALLFSWLIARVNALVSPQQDALSIAILDIYGFEVGLHGSEGQGLRLHPSRVCPRHASSVQAPPSLFSPVSYGLFTHPQASLRPLAAGPCAEQHQGPREGPDLGPALGSFQEGLAWGGGQTPTNTGQSRNRGSLAVGEPREDP